ncbi:MAG: metallophosphoesterase [Patescibacteria group bacterium]|jgi:serine/threonine protein phosphatase 1
MNYIIGDIHGNFTELEKLLTIIKPQANDRLIFLGDYLDKNSGTKRTLDLLHQLADTHDCVFLKGNHEYVWEKYLLGHELQRRDFLLKFGGLEMLKEFSPEAERLLLEDKIDAISVFLKEYLNLLPHMKNYATVGSYLALHAGITDEQMDSTPLVFDEPNYFLRPDHIPTELKYLGQYTLVAGHTHLSPEPVKLPGYINVDLGAGFGKYLGAFCPETSQVIRSDGKIFELG